MGNQGTKRIVLADDHAAILEQIRRLLEQEYEIVAAVEDGQALVEVASRLQPDLIISDISMPEMNGFEAAGKIRKSGSDAKLIFLTGQSSSPYLKKARSLKADGYVLKVHANEQLPEAVSTVLTGGIYYSPELSSEVQK